MLTEISIIFEKNMMYMRFFTTTKAIWQDYQCRYNFKLIGHFMQIFSIVKGPVTLLRMKETYEKRMKINEIIFICTKIL